MHNLIPHFIYEQYEAGNVNGRLQATTLFLDISGFTAMTQSLVQHGKEGAEIVVFLINQVFDPIINTVYEHGGFVTGFAGDALTVVFPQQDEHTAITATHVALSIAQIFLNQGVQATKFGDFTLVVKQGLSAGEIEWGIIGLDHHKTYFFRGQAIDGCALAEQQASGGDIIVDERLQTLLPPTMASLTLLSDQFAQLVALAEITVDVSPMNSAAIDPEIMSQFFPLEQWQTSQQGEFRDVSAIFVSFQGVPDLAAINHFVSQAMILVEQFDGFFVEVDFGDKGGLFLVYFGAPVTHENDVERALNFILALQTEFADIDLEWRAGITFGTVYAGYVGIPLRDKYTCMGSIVNLAARLMMQAEWGQVLVSESIALHPNFDFASLGQLPYKRFRQLVPTYLLQGKTVAERIFSQKIVGREVELQQVVEFAQPLFAGQNAGVVVIYGEAGIGKSHLTYELGRMLGSKVRWMAGQSDLILREAFNPFVYFLKEYFGQSITATEAENKVSFEHHLQRLLTALTQISDSQHQHDELDRTRSFLGALLGLYWPDSLYEQLDAKGRYQNTIIAVSMLLQAECRRQPVIIELEDGHWLDEASRELLAALTRQTKDVPLLILITSRYADDGSQPEFIIDPDTPLLTLDLAALTAVSINELAQTILNTPIDASLNTILIEKSQANPFFAQQILYYLQENELLRVDTVDGQPVTALATDTFDLPSTLNALLVARLDRLTQQVKNVVQTAAVLGREFELRLLAKMLKQDIEAEVIMAEQEQVWSLLNELQYIFKHILMRDAAYEMQLRARLRELHYLAAVTGEQLYAHQLSAYYDILAYHYETAYLWGQADAGDQARHYLQQAGQQALASFENSNAADYFSRALSITPESDVAGRYKLYLSREKAYNRRGNRLAQHQDLAMLITLSTELGAAEQAVAALRQASYAEVTNDYPVAIVMAQEAIDLADQTGDGGLVAVGHKVCGRALYGQSKYAEAIVQLKIGVALAEQVKATETMVQCWRNLGQIAHAQADYETARSHYLQALQLARQMGDQLHEGRLLLDLGESDWQQSAYERSQTYLQQSLLLAQTTGDRLTAAAAFKNLGVVAYFQGQYEEAISYFEPSLVISQEIDDRTGMDKALNNLGLVAFELGQYDEVIGYFKQCLLISQEIGDRAGEGVALNNLGAAAHALGQHNKVIDYFEQSLVISQEIGDRAGEGIRLNNLGVLIGTHGRYKKAKAYLEQSLIIAQEIGDRDGEGTALNSLGEIAYAKGQYEKAKRCFEQSLIICEETDSLYRTGEVLNNLGAVALAQADFFQSQKHYEQALTIHQELEQLQYLVENWAGLAQIKLAQGDQENARRYGQKILTYLSENPNLDGIEKPIQTLHFTWQVCQELKLAQADDVLAMAVQIMQTYLDNQPDPAARAVYLGQVHQRPLWTAWQKKQGV